MEPPSFITTFTVELDPTNAEDARELASNLGAMLIGHPEVLTVVGGKVEPKTEPLIPEDS